VQEAAVKPGYLFDWFAALACNVLSMSKTSCRPTPIRRFLNACGHIALITVALAASPALWAQGPGNDLEKQIEALIKPALVPNARVSIQIGQLDPRLNLAPCAQAEPFVPAGARLWGRTALGIRCVQGARWSVALPVTISVFAPALVASRNLANNVGANPGDFRLAEIELTREPSVAVTSTDQLAGMSLNRGLAAGQTLLLEHLRITPTVAQGDPVRVVVSGQGFSMSTEGQAVAAAGEGQSVRVKLENGKVVAGTLRGRTVEISLCTRQPV
jgi:flagellar basal body P-ring formation protein FlgA